MRAHFFESPRKVPTYVPLAQQPKLDNLAGEIWKSAERLRGKFKAYEYQSVILPIIVIRRLECVLIEWREDKAAEVLAKRPKITEKELAKLVKELETSTAPFSNKTNWTLRKVYEEDHTLLEENFRAYINGFSKNVDDIIEHFNYRATIGQMVKNNRLAPILNQYKELELGPDKLSRAGDGLHLRGIAPALLGTERRGGWRALHAARSHPADGGVAGHPHSGQAPLHLRSRLRHWRHVVSGQGTSARPRRHAGGEGTRSRSSSPSTGRNCPRQLRHLPGRLADQERPAGQGPSRQLTDPARPAQQRAG